MRNPEKGSNLKSVAEKENLSIRVIQLDVTDDNSIAKAVQTVLNEAGRIDVLVNNAGYGLMGAFEDLAIDEIKSQYETNVFGLIRTTQAVLPAMRRQRSGTIVNISSGAGRFGYPAASAYVSTKFAVEGLSESLSFEVEPFGIKVVLIEPGMISTNFFSSVAMAKKSLSPDSAYSRMIKAMEETAGKLMQNASSPELVARIVLGAVTSKNPKLRYQAGKDVEQWVESKNKMSDEEFHNMMKQI
jgi:short-subunit dehydrogenase